MNVPEHPAAPTGTDTRLAANCRDRPRDGRPVAAARRRAAQAAAGEANPENESNESGVVPEPEGIVWLNSVAKHDAVADPHAQGGSAGSRRSGPFRRNPTRLLAPPAAGSSRRRPVPKAGSCSGSTASVAISSAWTTASSWDGPGPTAMRISP